MDLPAEVTSGDRRRALVAIRAQLASALAEADAQYVASLARELRAVVAEIDALPGAREGSVSDDLAARRTARRDAARRAAAESQ